MRLAVVSSDGKNVDLHLGRGKSVYVYDYADELKFVERRDVEISEDAKHQGGKVIKACHDCDAGIRLVMDEGPVDEVLQRYIDHYNFMNS